MERCWQLFIDYFINVDVAEPRMLQQFLKVILGAKSFTRILVQALCDEILTVLTDRIVLREEL